MANDPLLFMLPPPSGEQMHEEITKTKTELGNLRRGIFQRFDILKKELEQIEKEISAIKGQLGDKSRDEKIEPLFQESFPF